MIDAWSVVVPCYRSDWQLAEAVQSALDVGCRDSNIVLVSDGDGGPGLDLALRIAPAIRVIRHGDNKGIAATRTTGLAAVTTPLMTFLDQDDRFLPGMKRAVERAAMYDYVRPVVGGINIFEESGSSTDNRLWPKVEMQWQSAGLDLMFEMAQIGRWVLPTSIAQRCRFPLDVGFGDDKAFLVQLASISDVLILPDTVLMYRVHGSQTSSQSEQAITTSQWAVLEDVLREVAGKRFSEKAIDRRVRAANLYWRATRHRQEDNRLSALATLLKAIGNDPTAMASSISRRVLVRTTASYVKSLVRGEPYNV